MSSDEKEDKLTDIEDIPQSDNIVDEGEESNYSFINIRAARRMAIAYLFVHEFNAAKDEKQWPETNNIFVLF